MAVSPVGAGIAGALLLGVALPWLWMREVPSEVPFQFEPPPGYEAATGELRRSLVQGVNEPHEKAANPLMPSFDKDPVQDRAAWFTSSPSGSSFTPRVVQIRSSQRVGMSGKTLATIAENMREHQSGRGLDYTTEEVRVLEREDGAKVGWVRWAAESAAHSSQPAVEARSVVQMSFPVNDGLAIVTASMAKADQEALLPALEQSVHRSTGLAKRSSELGVLRFGLVAAGAALGYALARGLAARSKAKATPA